MIIIFNRYLWLLAKWGGTDLQYTLDYAGGSVLAKLNRDEICHGYATCTRQWRIQKFWKEGEEHNVLTHMKFIVRIVLDKAT